jgi:DNA-directed RNA polymerase subunit RPC12/RpoP
MHKKMTTKPTFKTIKSEDVICDICGSSLLDRPKVNEPITRPPTSNKSPMPKANFDFKLSSYRCIKCKKPLKIPLDGFELNQKLNDLLDLNNLLQTNLKNLQKYSELIRIEISNLLKGKLSQEESSTDGKICISLLKKTFESLEAKPNQTFNYLDGEEYLTSYFSDIKIQVIKHQLAESNKLIIKSDELISKIDKQEKMCLSNVDQVKDTNKLYGVHNR